MMPCKVTLIWHLSITPETDTDSKVQNYANFEDIFEHDARTLTFSTERTEPRNQTFFFLQQKPKHVTLTW